MKLEPEITRLQSNFQQLQSQIPAGQDPFGFALNYITHFSTTRLPLGTLIALNGFFVFHIVISLSCMTVLILPLLRNQREQQWIVRKLYIEEPSDLEDEEPKTHPSPLYLVNSGMLMAFSQLLGSVSDIVYLRLWMPGDFRSPSLLIVAMWASFEFEFIAYWLMAWGSLCTWLYSGNSYSAQLKKFPRRTHSPFSYNLVFLMLPIFGIIITLTCVCLLISSVNRETGDLGKLESQLESLSLAWKSSQTPENPLSDPTLLPILVQGAAKLEELTSDYMWSLQGMVSRYKMVCATWASVIFITAMVFIYSLWKLLELSFKRINETSVSGLSTEAETRLSIQAQIPTFASEAPEFQKTRQNHDKLLRRRVYNLAFRGLMATLGIFCSIVYWTVGSFFTAEFVINQSWREAMSWFSLISSTAMALPITLQCWRIYRDKGELSQVSETDSNDSTRSYAFALSEGALPQVPAPSIELEFPLEKV